MKKLFVLASLSLLVGVVGASFRLGLGSAASEKSAEVMGPRSMDTEETAGPEADVTSPEVVIVSPIIGAPISGNVPLGVTASDNTGITRVSIDMDDVTIANFVTTPFQTTWNSRSLANGNHTLTAKAFDAAGNMASTSVVVSVNNPPLNFVVFLTDDQPFHTLWAMPKVQNLLIAQGVEFSRGYTTSPLCCPARASLMSGGFFAHNTGVLDNLPLNGGALLFKDDTSLPLRLQQKGYVTGMFGKYVNGINTMVNLNAGTGYIPPGWTRFDATLYGGQTENWFDFRIIRGGSEGTPGVGSVVRVQSYHTDYVRDQAVQFLQDHPGEPFFLYIAPWAPHLVATPAPEDVALFPDYLYRGRGYGETDLTDKPLWVREEAAEYALNVSTWDANHRLQLRSLQAADRMVESVINELSASNRLENTVFFFTSDNGFSWGEHGLRDKNHPYEEAVRVPMIVRWPGVTPRQDSTHLVAMNLDIGKTVLKSAGIDADSDGRDLLPLLTNPTASWRSTLFLEGYPVTLGSPLAFVAVVSENSKYIEYEDGFKEFFHYGSDPYEEENQISNPAYAGTIEALKSEAEAHKGTAITTLAIPEATLNIPYSFSLSAWGGGGGYVWSLSSGSLPAGLTLSSDGVISGTPNVRRTTTIGIRVDGTAVARQAARVQRYKKNYVFKVK